MSLEKTNCGYLNKSKIKEEQIIVDSVFAPESTFLKMLWVEADAQIDGIDALTKEVSFSGKVNFETKFLDADNKIQTYISSVPFLNKIIDDKILPNSKVRLTVDVTQVDYLESTEKLQAILSVNGCVANMEEIPILCGGDEELCVKTNPITSLDLIKSECTLFSQDISYAITDKMDNILGVKSKVCLKNITPNENFFVVEGEVITSIKYITNSEDIDKIITINYSEPYRREIEVSGLTENGKIDATAFVKYDLYKYELDKENKKLNISVPINICYNAFEEISLPSAIDAYSLTNNLEIVTNSYQKTNILKSEYAEQKIEGSVVIDNDDPRIDKIVGFSNGVLKITNTYYQDGEVYVEGLIDFDIAYLNDELNTTNTLHKEIPFTVKLEIELPADVNIFANSVLGDVEIIARRGREIFLDGKIKTYFNFTTNETEALITSVENGEEFPAKKHSIEIYFGKTGDTLWDISKELKVKPETISIQNPDLILPLEQNENIVIYNTRK